MATFKVGDKVRILSGEGHSLPVEWFITYVLRLKDAPMAAGREGVIESTYSGRGTQWLHWEVWVPDLRETVLCHNDNLRHLTPERQEQFIEAIKKTDFAPRDPGYTEPKRDFELDSI